MLLSFLQSYSIICRKKMRTWRLSRCLIPARKILGNSFICTCREDVETVLSWLAEKKWVKKLCDFGLTENLVEIYGEDEEELFIELRSAYLAEQEETFIKALLFD